MHTAKAAATYLALNTSIRRSRICSTFVLHAGDSSSRSYSAKAQLPQGPCGCMLEPADMILLNQLCPCH